MTDTDGQNFERQPASGLFGIETKLGEMRDQANLEVCLLVDEAQDLVREFGVDATLISGNSLSFDTNGDPNNEPVKTTKTAFKQEIDGDTYYIRPVMFDQDSEAGEDIYLILDETPDYKTVATRDISLIRIEVGDKDGEVPGLYDMAGVNVPLDVNLSLTIIRKLREQEDQNKQEEDFQAQQIARQEQRAALDRARRQQEEADAREVRRQDEFRRRQLERRGFPAKAYDAVKRNAGTIGKRALQLVAIAGVGLTAYEFLPGAYDDISRAICADKCDVQEYDAKKYSLNDGNVIVIGETGKPLHTFEATQASEFRRNKVPELGDLLHPGSAEQGSDEENDEFGPDVNGVNSKNPANIDNPRQIVLTTSKPKKGKELACEGSNVKFDSPRDGILVATDFPNSRTNEVEVSVTEDHVYFCWSRGSKERNASDDPRIIFQRLTPLQVAMRRGENN